MKKQIILIVMTVAALSIGMEATRTVQASSTPAKVPALPPVEATTGPFCPPWCPGSR